MRISIKLGVASTFITLALAVSNVSSIATNLDVGFYVEEKSIIHDSSERRVEAAMVRGYRFKLSLD